MVFKNLIHHWREYKLVQLFWREIWQYPSKLKTCPLLDIVIPLLRTYLTGLLTQMCKEVCIRMFTTVSFSLDKA